MPPKLSTPIPWIAIGLIAVGAALSAFFEVEAYVGLAVAGCIGLVVMYLKPEYGILAFTTTFFLYYPPILKGAGKITPNNLLGAMFFFLLCHQWLQKRDLWFLKVRQIQIFAAISVIFLISAWFAPSAPRVLAPFDRSQKEIWDFFTQLAFLIFMIHFIKSRDHLSLLFALLLLLICMTAPSVFYTGLGAGGTDDYRAAATIGIQSAKNSNRLAFFSIFGIASLWYLRQDVRSPLIRNGSVVMTGLFLLVVFLSASRSALVNLVVLAIILTREAGVDLQKILTTVLVAGTLIFLTVNIVPEQNLKRMTAFGHDPSQREATKSMDERVSNLKAAVVIFSQSNPLLGVGPGNFRWLRHLHFDRKHVATHNGFLWALVTGGVGMFLLYLWLFWTTWKDLKWLQRQPLAPDGPPRWLIRTVRTTFLLFLVFSLFAEFWLEIIIYLLIGMTIVMKRLQENSTSPQGQTA
ncbi:MAG: O-antigen ligase family protein [Desulfobacteraceae bacterium]|nr:O-antigen ligase family protein [Desulfobacteraceae bacterium]